MLHSHLLIYSKTTYWVVFMVDGLNQVPEILWGTPRGLLSSWDTFFREDTGNLPILKELILSLRCDSITQETCLKKYIFLIQQTWNGAEESAFLMSLQWVWCRWLADQALKNITTNETMGQFISLGPPLLLPQECHTFLELSLWLLGPK